MTTTSATAEDVTRLTKQNAMLLRALMRAKAERDALLKRLAETATDAEQVAR